MKPDEGGWRWAEVPPVDSRTRTGRPTCTKLISSSGEAPDSPGTASAEAAPAGGREALPAWRAPAPLPPWLPGDPLSVLAVLLLLLLLVVLTARRHPGKAAVHPVPWWCSMTEVPAGLIHAARPQEPWCFAPRAPLPLLPPLQGPVLKCLTVQMEVTGGQGAGSYGLTWR